MSERDSEEECASTNAVAFERSSDDFLEDTEQDESSDDPDDTDSELNFGIYMYNESVGEDEESCVEAADNICSRKIGKVTVTVAKGDVTGQKTGAIVCGVPGSLVISQGGAVANALLQKDGESLQNKCKEQYPNGIKAGEIASVKSNNLMCDTVFFVCIPQSNSKYGKKVLSNTIYKCLSKASGMNFTSIAFPALGTGKLGYNVRVVAELYSSAVESFTRRHPESALTDVICILNPSDSAVLQSFKQIFSDNSSETDISPRTISSVKCGSISVKLSVGILTEQRCDVIVGTCTRKMELSKGSLSNAILNVAGPALQTECSQKYPQGIQHGEIAVLSPGNMSCASIYLAALPRYDKSPADAEETPTQLLSKLVRNCLAQALKHRRSTLYFPTFGTGYLKYPPQVSAKTMLEAVSEFNTNNHGVMMTLNIVLHADRSNLQKNLKPFLKIFKQNSTSSEPSSPHGASFQPERFTPQFCEHMYRISEHRPPEYWTHFTNMRPIKDWQIDSTEQSWYELVDLDSQEIEFQTVENLVESTWEKGKVGHGRDARGLDDLDFNAVKVTKVQRVENLPMYQKYVNRRAELFHKAGVKMIPLLEDLEGLKHGGMTTVDNLDSDWQERLYGEVNEGYLFHGTKTERVENLLKQGIDVRMAQGGAVFGGAVYLAESSTKSDQYTDERDSRRMTGLQMFLVKACLGEIKVMQKTHRFRRPPCLEDCLDDECCHERYDSIVEELKYIFREFVVYDTHQAYPEYIITYDRVKK